MSFNPNPIHDELQKVVDKANSGELINATKKELEHYAVLVCHGLMNQHGNPIQISQIGDTIRLLLLVRISEETQNEGMKIATAGLKISKYALLLVIVQIVLALPPIIEIVRKWFPQSTQVPQAKQLPPLDSAPSSLR